MSKINKLNIARIIKRIAKNKLEEFREYTLGIESKFNSEKKRLDKSYNDAIKNLSGDEIEEIEDFFPDDYYMIEEIHVGMYRKSTLVSVYSFLENSLNHLCEHLCASHSYPVKLDDLKDKGIMRAKNYLEKLVKVDFSLLNGEWSYLQTLNKIRNCIIHCEGDVTYSTNESKLRNIVNDNPSLSLRSDRIIKVEREYVDFCITKTEEFLDKLYQQVFSA